MGDIPRGNRPLSPHLSVYRLPMAAITSIMTLTVLAPLAAPQSPEYVALAASLFQRGFSVGSAGNITVRVDGGFLATPTNSSLGRLDAARLSLLDEDWNHLDGDKPTKEVFLHQAVYDARPSATATGSPYM